MILGILGILVFCRASPLPPRFRFASRGKRPLGRGSRGPALLLRSPSFPRRAGTTAASSVRGARPLWPCRCASTCRSSRSWPLS